MIYSIETRKFLKDNRNFYGEVKRNGQSKVSGPLSVGFGSIGLYIVNDMISDLGLSMVH